MDFAGHIVVVVMENLQNLIFCVTNDMCTTYLKVIVNGLCCSTLRCMIISISWNDYKVSEHTVTLITTDPCNHCKCQ